MDHKKRDALITDLGLAMLGSFASATLVIYVIVFLYMGSYGWAAFYSLVAVLVIRWTEKCGSNVREYLEGL